MNAPHKAPDHAVLRGGSFFGAGLVLVTIVFLFSPLYLVQFLCLFLLFILLGSKAYSEYLIRNISIRRPDRELRIFKHEWVRIELLVENHGRFPALLLAVQDNPGSLAVFRDNKAICTLRSHSRTALVWQAHCSDRGIFTLGPASFRSSDPLGIFPFRVTASETVKLFVYPASGMIALRNPGGIPLGTLISPNPLYEDMTRCRSVRTYHAGDDPRRINWRATARTREIMVNEYESTVSYPLVVFLNTDPNAYPLKKRERSIERSIEAAAALCLMASRERQDLGIIIYTPGFAEPVTVIKPSAYTLIPILERLAALERAKQEEPVSKQSNDENSTTILSGGAAAMLERGKDLPYGTRLIYTGPELPGKEYMILDSLKRYHLSLEYLVIDERSLPSMTPGNSRRYQMKEMGYEII